MVAHTASTKSILKDLFSIRDDAENRLGDVGIGCTITNVMEDYVRTHHPQSYSRNSNNSSIHANRVRKIVMVRNEDGDPIFVENREIDSV